jgi:multiple sugar transport system ATP-binding protein
MAAIEMRNIVKEYGDGFKAVKDVSLDIADGEFMILVGPSGCGKSTLLRMIVGLEDITSGDMLIGGKRVNDKAPRERNLSMVFQNYALYPHLTVYENIAFPLRLAKMSDEEVRRRVTEASDVLELGEHLERKPANLSGGQRQRVAMGRAIVRQAEAFLFDEPLSNLDAKLRGQMRTEISRLQRRLGITTVYVTHDQTEAMTLGDRVAVLRKGLLQQVASPRELYEQPVNLFVAGFIGSPPMNFLPVTLQGDSLETPFGRWDMPAHRDFSHVAGHDILLAGVRPEYFEDAALVEGDKKARGATFRARVDVTEWLGDSQYAYIPFDAPEDVRNQLRDLSRELDSDQLRTQAIVSIDAMSHLREGRDAEFWVDSSKIHLFDPKTGENLTRDPEAGARYTREVAEEREEQIHEAQSQGQTVGGFGTQQGPPSGSSGRSGSSDGGRSTGGRTGGASAI